MLVNLQSLIDDAKCYETVRHIRWPEGVSCPKCDSKRVVKQGLDETQSQRQRYQCKDIYHWLNLQKSSISAPLILPACSNALQVVLPHQYVIQQRVERAKLMLSKTDLTIADIALQVGFSSQSHLTQQFKRLAGMTPKQGRSSS
jgi:transposase-like protein